MRSGEVSTDRVARSLAVVLVICGGWTSVEGLWPHEFEGSVGTALLAGFGLSLAWVTADELLFRRAVSEPGDLLV